MRPFDNLNFGRKDFTIELEALPLMKSGNSSVQTIFSNKNTRDGFSFGLSINNTIYINMPNNIVYESNNIGNIYDGNCHHFAITRRLDEIKF